MQKRIRRFVAMMLAVFMLLPVNVLAAVMGTELDSYITDIGSSAELSHGVYWTEKDYRRENYIEYTPNETSFPVVVYGSKLLNYGKFSTMASLLEKRGLHVIAGINGDYFNTANYEPIGLVISQGEVISSDGGLCAVGFRGDGTAFVGKPGMSMSVVLTDEEYPLLSVNKALTESGFALFTEEYSITNRAVGDGRNIVLSVSETDRLTMNCAVTLTVEEITETSGAFLLPEGKMVLSLSDAAPENLNAALDALKVGDCITVKISSDCVWDEMEYAVGSLYRLVENGQVSDGLEDGTAPRTAVGVKADGTVVFYTVDGRQPGHSVGATMTQVAQRLIELGCVDAGIMDGGGSTSMNAIYPGEESLAQINTPSGGYQRPVTNYIMLVTTAEKTGAAEKLAVYPQSSRLLVGASVEFSVKASDINGYASEVPSGVSYSIDNKLGQISSDGVFYAKNSGEGKIQISSPGMESAAAKIVVVQTPDEITVRDEESGEEISELKLEIGQTVSLTAYAKSNHLELISSDDCFSWEVEGDIGTMDDTGFFTAADRKGQGNITVAAGDLSVSIPVDVEYPAGYFEDVSENDWFSDAVKFVAEKGFYNGTSELMFSPHQNMSRAMMATVLYRMAGEPVVENKESAFADTAKGTWYSDAVAWAACNGIVKGNGDGTFSPDDPITREQMAQIFKNYSDAAGLTSAAEGDLSEFSDSESISGYAIQAMSWAVGRGLIQGSADNLLEPGGAADRAQVAVMVQRFCALS